MATPTTAGAGGGWTARLVLSTIFLAMVLEALSLGATMISIGLPSILKVFPTSQGGWLITAYYLSGAILAPILGKAADLYGKRRVLLFVVAVSCLGAVVCALSPSFIVLVIGRALQGVILATLSLTASLIRDVYPPGPAAFAASITVTGMGMFVLVSPILVGWLIEAFGFRGMFWFDAIWTAALCVAIRLTCPESSLRRRSRPDVIGGLLLSFGVLAILLYVSLGRTLGWAAATTLVLPVVGVVLLYFFVRHVRRVEDPIVKLGLFTTRPLIFVTVLGAIGYGLAGSAGTILPMMAITPRDVGGTYGLGLTTVQYALIGTPCALAGVLAGLVLGASIARGGSPRLFMLFGLAMWAVGLILIVFRHDTLAQMIVGASVYGVGSGLTQSSIPNLIMAATPQGDQGSTAGAVQMVQTGWGSVLPVVMFTVLAGSSTVNPAGGVVYAGAGFELWLLISAATAIVGLVLGLTVLRARAGSDRFDAVDRSGSVAEDRAEVSTPVAGSGEASPNAAGPRS